MAAADAEYTMKYSKTEAGQQAFKDRSSLISARQRMAFILFDGEKPLEKVLAATAGAGVTQADIDHMVSQGFLVAEEPKTVPVPLALDLQTKQQRYAAAKLIATEVTASLGLRGFRLNLAVEAAAGYDELLNLLPKIQEAVGPNACRPLEEALKG
jgi:hypothetical protein